MKLKNLIYLSILITFICQNLLAIENKILFKIDDEIVSSIDVYNKIKYLRALNQNIKNLDNEEIYELSKNLIIKEKIKKIKLQDQNIKIDIKENNLNPYIKSLFVTQGISNLNEFENFTKSLNLNFEPIKETLIIELLWNNLIFSKFSSKIKINKKELKKLILENKNNKITSYLLSEIVFQVGDKTEIKEKYAKIKLDIKNEGFKKAAIIHSLSDSSTNGGAIGWIEENSLNKKILEAVKNLKAEEISEPLLIPGGFLILKVDDKKFKKRVVDLEKEINKLIKSKTNQQLTRYSNMYFNKIRKEIVINEL
tara:strand:- start:1586 stop:2515 length:930 start_codon:yes stop_codon:yes gene_type:complete